MVALRSHSKWLPKSGLLCPSQGPGWMGAVWRCHPEGRPGPLTSVFSTGIKQDPNRFVVPRTVMIGGKVRSQDADCSSGPLTPRLRLAWLGCRLGRG